ncbi:hypothetical protein BH23GEM9_BH23GEM9_33160 [soil metagenome]
MRAIRRCAALLVAAMLHTACASDRDAHLDGAASDASGGAGADARGSGDELSGGVVVQALTERRPARDRAGQPPLRDASIRTPVISGTPPEQVLARVQAVNTTDSVFGVSLADLREDGWLTDLDFRVVYNRHDILDIEWTMSGVGAYPSQRISHAVTSVLTGERLRARDIFTESSLPAIAALLEERANARVDSAHRQMVGDGLPELQAMLEPRRIAVEDLDSFSVSDDGVAFIVDFDMPHVARLYEPRRRHEFTRAELRDFIRDDGVLAYMQRAPAN